MAGLSTFQSGPKGSKVVQRDPKGSKMVNLDVFDHLGPLWARLDPFGPFQSFQMFFFLKSTSAQPYFVLMGQQKGSQVVKNI